MFDGLVSQIGSILGYFVTKEFKSGNEAAKARALFLATNRFHHPAHAPEWKDPEVDKAFDAIEPALVWFKISDLGGNDCILNAVAV